VFTSAFEPGSTAKPFTAAALLALQRVQSSETVSGENGEWTYATAGGHTRTVHDTHAQHVPITLARAIQVSSNIAVAKFASRLRAEEQYEMLRAFGFGSPTGVEFPSEASGVLARPHTWREGYSAQSIAMGYEVQVTPVQLAAAYGVFANDGVLLAPTLIKEIRDADGRVLYRHQPEVVRRVISSEVAATIRGFLADAASDSGTGSQAQLRFGIIGKTGTAKELENGSYASGKYRASFAAIFPARDPQLVAVVTIDKPHSGAYYGGVIAAPLTAEMLRQALAARRSVIDRGALEDAEVDSIRPTARPGKRVVETPAAITTAVRLPLSTGAPGPQPTVVVPEVAGRSVRAAAFALHQRGLRVRVDGAGIVIRSVPAAGDSLTAGNTVLLVAKSERP
jgi:cell division protein FtsI (penicillin-binding protein 3)